MTLVRNTLPLLSALLLASCAIGEDVEGVELFPPRDDSLDELPAAAPDDALGDAAEEGASQEPGPASEEVGSAPTSEEAIDALPTDLGGASGGDPDRAGEPEEADSTRDDAADSEGGVDAEDSALPGLIRGPEPTESSASTTGPFDVETLTQGLRNGPDYGSQTLFYPTDAEPPFAMVAIVPGFVSPESSIRQWGPFLASHGMVVLTIGTNTGGDPPAVRAEALMDALETVAAENDRASSPLAGNLDLTRRAVMGWSMGGGGTLIAASDNPELSAAISLAGWSPGVRFDSNDVPTLLFAGTADILAGGQSQGFFESIPESTPKMLFEVAGGSHSIANAPTGAGGQVGLYGLSWLKVFLEGDERYLPFLLETPPTQSDFRQNLR